jgi:hypothetical protein
VRNVRNPQGREFTVQFFKDGPNIRYDRRLTARLSPKDIDKSTEATGILRTPTTSARVYDPVTDHSFVEFTGREKKKVEADVAIRFARFVNALYAIDEVSILDKIQSQSYKVTQATIPPDHQDWILITCEYEEPSGNFVAKGKLHLTLSPSEHWAIRAYRLASGPPFNFLYQCSIPQLLRTGDSYIAKEYTSNFYHIDKPGNLDSDDNATWVEGSDFQLVDVVAGPVDPEKFTLESMGVGDRRGVKSTTRIAWIMLTPLIAFAVWLLIRFKARSNAITEQTS